MPPSPTRASALTPYAIDLIEQNGKPVYRHTVVKPVYLADGETAPRIYQLRTILEGVVARRHARLRSASTPAS